MEGGEGRQGEGPSYERSKREIVSRNWFPICETVRSAISHDPIVLRK